MILRESRDLRVLLSSVVASAFCIHRKGRNVFRIFTTCALLLAAASASAATTCTLVVDAGSGAIVARRGDGCDTRNSPASTFKIAMSLMGYDAGILQDAHTPAWPFKPGYPAWREAWKQTTDPTRWLAESVVWYSQVLTRKLGMARFQKYVDAFDYGNRDVSGDPGTHNGLTHAWLSSSLQISPAEEVALVRKLVNGSIPASPRAREMTMAIMPAVQGADGWTVHGKTGSGDVRVASGRNDPDRQFGWFVGWAERGGRTVVFARLIKDETKIAEPAGFRARDSLVADLPALVR